MNLDEYLMSCLRSSRQKLIQNAAMGWEYAARIDHCFLWKSGDAGTRNEGSYASVEHDVPNLTSRSTDSLLERTLGALRKDLSQAVSSLETLCAAPHPELLIDSYFSSGLAAFFQRRG